MSPAIAAYILMAIITCVCVLIMGLLCVAANHIDAQCCKCPVDDEPDFWDVACVIVLSAILGLAWPLTIMGVVINMITSRRG